MIINIIIGIVIISFIAIAHELGHYLTAKASKVGVEEFGLGLPPRIIGKKWGDTLYSINWIPFGAFVKMSGEIDPDVPNSLASKKPGVRVLVLAAGSIMTILLAFLVLSVAYMVPHRVVTEPVVVKDIAPGSPAAIAGIEAEDVLLSINGDSLENVSDLVRTIQLNLGEEITILTRHSDASEEMVSVVPRWKPPEGEGAIGIELDLKASALARTVSSRSYPFWEAIPKGATELFEIFVLYKDGIISMITGTTPVALVGPVGIVQLAGEVAEAGLSPLLEFAAIISLILGIINLFPLPALDGGRIIFVILEWLRRGKRVSPRIEGVVHMVGFFALIATAVAITYQDIIRIITGESLIP
jgi:regulator of sigma E protease